MKTESDTQLLAGYFSPSKLAKNSFIEESITFVFAFFITFATFTRF